MPMNPDLAVIIPYVGEFPHLHYTLQSLCLELEGHVTFEVIIVDNQCLDAERYGYRASGQHTDIACTLGTMLKDQDHGWLKRMQYTEKLSHWACKNVAIKNTRAPFLFFLDAHCLISPGSLRQMVEYYRINREWLNGSLHLPISDFFKQDHSKIYRLIQDPDAGLLHYENKRMTPDDYFRYSNGSPGFCFEDDPMHPVSAAMLRPCMSTCGMLCRREYITEDLDHWPEELGPYGGGENYFNFAMAQMGRRSHVFLTEPLRHWHVPGIWSRDYQISYEDWARNIMIATYLVAGSRWLDNLSDARLLLPEWHPCRFVSVPKITQIRDEILTSASLLDRRARLADRFTIDLEEWLQQWPNG